MKVSLRQPRGAEDGAQQAAPGGASASDPHEAEHFLAAGGPFRILGGEAAVGGAEGTGVEPLRVRAATMFGPRGVALGPGGGPVAVCDSGHHRLLLWHGLPAGSNAPADVVLGQANFGAVEANRGRPRPGADTLHWCYGVALVGERLVVADTGEARGPAGAGAAGTGGRLETGAAATGLAAQPDFGAKGDNRWQVPARDSLCWPYAVAARDGVLAVADSGNNRGSLWKLAAYRGP